MSFSYILALRLFYRACVLTDTQTEGNCPREETNYRLHEALFSQHIWVSFFLRSMYKPQSWKGD